MIRLYKKTKYGVVMLLVLAMILQVAGPVVSIVYAEDGDIPVVEEPGTEEPGEPETGEPETGEPGTEEPGTEEPGTEEPGIPLTPLVPSTPVGPVEFQFITGISLTDGEGNGLGNNVSNKSEVHITYSFAIPDDYDIEADQIYDLTLPDEIEIINTITILLNANGQLMAKVVIDVDNNITITFTEYATNMSGISGSFKVETKFDEKEIGNGGSTEIEFDLGGNSTEKITVDFDTEPETVDVHLIKSGNYDKDNNVITWTVKVKPETKPDLRPISNVIITDVIQEGQTYVDGSVIITPTETNGNFNFEDGELTYAFVGDINIKENEEYIITFKKKPDLSAFNEEGKTIYFKNQAESTFGDNGESISNEPSVSTTVDFINKSGKFVKGNTRAEDKIEWTININNNNLDIKNAKIVDIIPKGLKLDESTIMLNPAISGKTHDIAGSDTDANGTKLTYELGDISKSTL